MATVSEPREPIQAIEAVPPADMLYEIVDGQFVEKHVGAYELELAWLLQDLISPYLREHRLGRLMMEPIFDLRPAVPHARRPDLAFISFQRWPREQRANRGPSWRVVPELAVEIVSPSNTANEVIGKVHEYFLAGVERVWVVHHDFAKLYVYDSPKSVRILTRGDTLTDETLLPGFRLELSAFFGEPG